MDSFSIDFERFAYDIFRISWNKFEVPKKDIPFCQRKENGYSRNFIRSIARYVMFYQVLIRNNMELMMELELVNVDDECSMFEFFKNFMRLDKEVFKLQSMQNVACSLAICLELTLYKYPMHKRLLELGPVRWKTYFRQFLQQDFYLNGGFDGLLEHAESMHAGNYALDKIIYEHEYGSNILKISERYNIKIDDNIRSSIISLNDWYRSDNSRILRALYRSEKLPVVGKWIRWTRKRLESIGSVIFHRTSRSAGGLLGSVSDGNSPEISTEGNEISGEVDERAISDMIENYIKSVEEYQRRN